jgi:hypothetical protein
LGGLTVIEVDVRVEREALGRLAAGEYQALFLDPHLARVDLSPARPEVDLTYRHDEEIAPAEAERSAREVVQSYGLAPLASRVRGEPG